MSVDFYKITHFLGIFMVLSALGGQFGIAIHGGEAKQSPARRWLAIFHGAGLLITLVAGFGLIAKLGLGFEAWIYAKLGIWLVLGGVGAIASRKKQFAGKLWLLTLVLGVTATFLARTKPF